GLPFVRPGRLRTGLALAVVAVPLGFMADLWFWQRYAVTHLDPHAALSMIADRIRSQLWGHYSVAQFTVDAAFQSGFWLVVVAAAHALGFLVVEPRRPDALPSALGIQTPPRNASVAAALGIVLAAAPSAKAATLEVGPGQPFRSIGAAVAAA